MLTLDASNEINYYPNQSIIRYIDSTGAAERLRLPILDIALTDGYDCNGVILTDLVEIMLPYTKNPMIGDSFIFRGAIHVAVKIGEPVCNDCWVCLTCNLHTHYCMRESVEIWHPTTDINVRGARVAEYELFQTILLARLQPRKAGTVKALDSRLAHHEYELLILTDYEPIQGAQVRKDDVKYLITGAKQREHIAEPTILYLRRLS